MTLSTDKTDTSPLYIRVPKWCTAPSVAVNGYPVVAELIAGEYAALTAAWEDGGRDHPGLPRKYHREVSSLGKESKTNTDIASKAWLCRCFSDFNTDVLMNGGDEGSLNTHLATPWRAGQAALRACAAVE